MGDYVSRAMKKTIVVLAGCVGYADVLANGTLTVNAPTAADTLYIGRWQAHTTKARIAPAAGLI